MASKKRLTSKLNRKQTQDIIPVLSQFNKLANIFIGVLTRKIEAKEKRIKKINVLVQNKPLPIEKNFNISVQTIDMNNTKVRKKGRIFNQKMKWEQDYKANNNKGIIL